MGVFDFLFSNKKEKERLERERLAEQARARVERERKLKQERERLISESRYQFSTPTSQKSNLLPTGIDSDIRTQFYDMKDIKLMNIGLDFMLAPYDAYWYCNFIEADAAMISSTANTERICKYLPGLDFSSLESTKKKLESFIMRTEAQYGVTYVIRYKKMPIGMIIVDTPLFNNTVGLKLPIFTIDFFLIEAMEHNGIMYNSLARVLNVMKQNMGAKKVYATVDQSNTQCIKFLNKFFTQIDNSGFSTVGENDKKPLVFMMDLSTIRFEKR